MSFNNLQQKVKEVMRREDYKMAGKNVSGDTTTIRFDHSLVMQNSGRYNAAAFRSSMHGFAYPYIGGGGATS